MERQRDGILDSMLDGMSTTTQRRLAMAADEYIKASEQQALALADHEKTAMQLRQESERAQKEGLAETIRDWTREYEATGTEYQKDFELSEDERKLAKELKVDFDPEEANKFARGAIEGKLGKKQVVKLIQMGRVYPALKAKVDVLSHRLQEAEATIAKLRGASPGGGQQSAKTDQQITHPKGGDQYRNAEGLTREEWQKRNFSAAAAAAKA